MNTLGQKILVGLMLAGFVISLGLLYRSYVFSSNSCNPAVDSSCRRNDTAEPDTGTPTNSSVGITSGLQIDTQTPGPRLLIQSVSLDRPGFLVVYAVKDGEELGDIVGISSLLSGDYTDMDLLIDRDMQVDDSFWGALYVDNGNGAPDIPGDDVELKDSSDTPIKVRFTVTEETAPIEE